MRRDRGRGRRRRARLIRSSVVSSQVDLHARFGGVVPEIASRAHVELITPVIAEALVEAGVELADLDAVAACHGPGLAGALLVGVSAAKALALTVDLPYVGVNHLEAHLHAAWLARIPTSSCRSRCSSSRVATRMLVVIGGARPLPRARPDRRRRRRRGVRQGRALPRPRLPGRSRRSTGSRATATRPPSRFPRPMRGERRLLVLGAEDRGRQPRAQASRRAGRGRRRVVPGGGRRPAASPSCSRRPTTPARPTLVHRRRRGRELPPAGAGGGGGRGHRAPRVPAPARRSAPTTGR